MILLFETPAGFALFKVFDEGRLNKVEVLIYTLLVCGKTEGIYCPRWNFEI
jgi:hypothetical protein